MTVTDQVVSSVNDDGDEEREMAMTTQATYGAPATKKMKLEHDGSKPDTPQPSTSTPTPAPTYTTTAQWSTPIPIDPALQQQPTTTPTTTSTTQTTPAQVALQQIQRQAPIMNYQHYQAYGATHYPQYTPQHYAQYTAQTATIPTVPAATTTTLTSTTSAAPLSRQATQTPAVETDQNADISTLNDAVGSAGLDLRAEEETLQRSQDYYSSYKSYEDRSRRQPNSPAFDTRILGATMRAIGTRHKVSRIPEDAVNYLALALRARLQALIEAMADAAQHRATAQYDRAPSQYEDGTPMWNVVVRRDLKKQLEVLERVEREEEMRLRRERRERADAAAAANAQAAGSPMPDGIGATNGDDAATDGGIAGAAGKKSKKKKEGPGVTAKNMSEDVQKRLSNATAAQAAGLGRGKYAWMNAGVVSSAPSPAPTKSKASTSTQATTAAGQTAAKSWTKPYVPASAKASQSPAPGDEDKLVVTIRDAMFIIERERGHGAGRGAAAARGWV
ncbi:hypothetical protein A7U60_g5733 [Sanghuangporus baumii]|uniref:Transcription initiation factor TFIID subunit 4 n=1 Tax=Sanghuangporus baumii TaxID=108892 RepID=A0A9Q5HWH5_SANBA|nr:hypothetical protein A7U60_g5733 [Sanghuangporus baumii]